MKPNKYITLVITLSSFNYTFCNVFDSASSWFSSATDLVTRYYCHNIYECCDDKRVPYNLSSLTDMLSTKLYGQHIAADVVLNMIRSHLKANKQKKPLVLAFHGANGVGKSYVSRMIAKAFFEKGENSRYFHFYYGLDDFPDPKKILEYQVVVVQSQLKSEIQSALNSCERSLFVFDGVDQIPQKLLDVLMPFIDCVNCGSKSKKNKAIFIFLSNTGSIAIQSKLLRLMNDGLKREETTLQDFEQIISSEASSNSGGLFESLLIKSDAIDFYVPFLPLERRHVAHCIEDAFEELNVAATKDLTDGVFQELIFVPESKSLFSKSGCKRVSRIVAGAVEKLRPDYQDFAGAQDKAEL